MIKLMLNCCPDDLEADPNVATQFVDFTCGQYERFLVEQVVTFKTMRNDVDVVEIEVVENEAQVFTGVWFEEKLLLVLTEKTSFLQDRGVVERGIRLLLIEFTFEKFDRVGDTDDTQIEIGVFDEADHFTVENFGLTFALWSFEKSLE